MRVENARVAAGLGRQKTRDTGPFFAYAAVKKPEATKKSSDMTVVTTVQAGGPDGDDAHDAHVGIAPESHVMTPAGPRRAASLRAGARIITRTRGIAVLQATERIDLSARAVRMMPGALGPECPDRAIVLPQSQRIFLRDWRARLFFGTAQALVPAGRLVDGDRVTDCGPVPLTLCRLLFDAPQVLYADGLELACATPV